MGSKCCSGCQEHEKDKELNIDLIEEKQTSSELLGKQAPLRQRLDHSTDNIEVENGIANL